MARAVGWILVAMELTACGAQIVGPSDAAMPRDTVVSFDVPVAMTDAQPEAETPIDVMTDVVTPLSDDAHDAIVPPVESGTDAPAGDAPGGCFPPCLVRLMAPCPTVGACVESMPANNAIDECFQRGTQTRATFGVPAGVATVRAFTASGALCWTKTIRAGSMGSDSSGSYGDPGGRVVATFTIEFGMPSVTHFACDGMTYATDIHSAECRAMGYTVMCQPGMCP